MSSFSRYQLIGATFVLLATGLIGYFAGWDIRDQDLRSGKGQTAAHSAATASSDDAPARSATYSAAARVLEENFWTLGVPEDRSVSSFEAFWCQKTGDLHFLARLWPPWPVSQPEDAVKPLAWRAIEVTADGRCFLRAVATKGTSPWHDPLETDQYTGEVDSPTPPLPAANARPARRRVILPPVN